MFSKSRFMNLIRCPRFCALEEIKKFRKDSIVTMDDILEDEMESKIEALLERMFKNMQDDDGEDIEIDLIDVKNEHMDTMLPYYSKVELLAGEAIKNKFGGTVQYSERTSEQKFFSTLVNEYKFYCFVDGYQEDETEKKFNIFEVKATTTNKFYRLAAKINKEPVSIFEKTPSGILKLKEELYTNPDDYGLPIDKYNSNRSKLFDRHSDAGKYVYDLAFQRYVIENGLIAENKLDLVDKVKYHLVVLNPKYEFNGENYTDDIVDFVDLTQITKEMLPFVQADIDRLMTYIEEYNASPCKVDKKNCGLKTIRACKYTSICFKDLPEKNSILTYKENFRGFIDESGEKRNTYDLINDGFYSVFDIPKGWLTREINIIQRDAIENKKPYVKRDRIRKCIDSLRYPIYHLDFESFPCPIPRFVGEKAYTQSLFQYSIHVEHAPGVCDKEADHYGFLSIDNKLDERRTLVEEMLKVIDTSKPGTVLVYNQAFEKTRIKELAVYYPEFADQLHKLNDMVVDLLHFLGGSENFMKAIGCTDAKGVNYYHEYLQGSYSIKKVLPIFSNLTYAGMGVANGNDAMVTYASFSDLKANDEVKYKQKIQELIDYCKQDTWAMVEILEKLRHI